MASEPVVTMGPRAPTAIVHAESQTAPSVTSPPIQYRVP
jgi:hypothetical protein